LEAHQDEVWVKLDAGDQARFEKINGTFERLDDVTRGIVSVGKKTSCRHPKPSNGGQWFRADPEGS